MEKLLIGLVGVIVGAFLTVLREFFNEWRTKRNDSKYLAVRVTCILDRFISECFEVVCDNGMPDEDGCYAPNSIQPTINFDDLDVKWQSLKFELMYRLLDIPNRIIEANEFISHAYDYGDGPPDYSDFYAARQYQHALLGIEAYELSTSLQKKYSMPAKNYNN